MKEEGEEFMNWVEKEKLDGEFLEFDRLAEAEDAIKFKSLGEVIEVCMIYIKGQVLMFFMEEWCMKGSLYASSEKLKEKFDC